MRFRLHYRETVEQYYPNEVRINDRTEEFDARSVVVARKKALKIVERLIEQTTIPDSDCEAVELIKYVLVRVVRKEKVIRISLRGKLFVDVDVLSG